mgnify:CR=1 FL=1
MWEDLAGEIVVGGLWTGGHRDVGVGGTGRRKASVADFASGSLFTASWQLRGRQFGGIVKIAVLEDRARLK